MADSKKNDKPAAPPDGGAAGTNEVVDTDDGAPSRDLSGPLDEATQISLLETYYAFPGLFTIVVITRPDQEFFALLQATVAAEQGVDAFEIEVRPSRQGHYVAYRVHVHVASAHAALNRRRVLAALPDLYAVF